MDKSPKPQPHPPTQSRGSETFDIEQRSQMQSFFRTKISKLLERAAAEPDKKRFVISQIAQTKDTWFKGRENLLETILLKIEETPYTTDAEFEETIAGELINSVTAFIEKSGLSTEELQRQYKVMAIKMDGHIPLDSGGVLNYSRYEDTAELHIGKGLTPGVLKEAMSVFVPIIQNDESIKIIKAKSWVVAEKLSYFKRLGYTASVITDATELQKIRENLEGMDENLNKPIGEAYMTRDEFLKSPWAKLNRNPNN